VVVGLGNTACDVAVDLSSVCNQVVMIGLYTMPQPNMTQQYVQCNDATLFSIGFAYWPGLRARYVLVTDFGPSVVRPVVISRKLSKIDPFYC